MATKTLTPSACPVTGNNPAGMPTLAPSADVCGGGGGTDFLVAGPIKVNGSYDGTVGDGDTVDSFVIVGARDGGAIVKQDATPGPNPSGLVVQTGTGVGKSANYSIDGIGICHGGLVVGDEFGLGGIELARFVRSDRTLISFEGRGSAVDDGTWLALGNDNGEDRGRVRLFSSAGGTEPFVTPNCIVLTSTDGEVLLVTEDHASVIVKTTADMFLTPGYHLAQNVDNKGWVFQWNVLDHSLSETNCSIEGRTAHDGIPGDMVFRTGGTDWVAGSGTERVRITGPDGHVRLSAVPVFANNAAALAGGLVAGDLYQVTGTDPRAVAIVF